MKDNPLSSEKLSELFILNKEKNKLIKRESVTLEFKESFIMEVWQCILELLPLLQIEMVDI